MPSTLQPNPAPCASLPAAPAHLRLGTLWPLLLIAVLYLATSMGPAIFDQNEAQYAGAVREMLNRPGDYVEATRHQPERGRWYVPTNDGIPRLQKPPFVYWFLLASMKTLGVNEFGARLPNALFALLWFAGTYLLGRRIAGPGYGLAAATILGTMAGTYIFSHLIAPEPYLSAFLVLTFWCFLGACQEPQRAGRWMFWAWIFMGLGVGTKGLHGALYPLFVAAWLAWKHPETRPVWRKLFSPVGPLCVLAVLLPWYVAIEHKYPGFLRDQFINEQLGHVFNRRYPHDNNQVAMPVFWVEHLVLFLPWTFFIPAAWRSRTTPHANAGDALPRRLLRVWFGVTAVSLLFSGLQDYYLMTAWAPVALWLARPWADDAENRARTLPRWTRLGPGWCLAGIGTLILLAAVFLQFHGVGNATANGAAASPYRDTILTTLAGFSTAVWHSLLPLVWSAGAFFLLGGLAAMLLAAGGRWRGVLHVTAVMMLALLLLAARGLSVLEHYFSLKPLALTVNRLADAGATVICAGDPVDNPSLLFYLNREIYWQQSQFGREFASQKLGIGSALFLTDDECLRRWNSANTVFLICEDNEIDTWREKLRSVTLKVVAQSGTRVLLVNHAPR